MPDFGPSTNYMPSDIYTRQNKEAAAQPVVSEDVDPLQYLESTGYRRDTISSNQPSFTTLQSTMDAQGIYGATSPFPLLPKPHHNGYIPPTPPTIFSPQHQCMIEESYKRTLSTEIEDYILTPPLPLTKEKIIKLKQAIHDIDHIPKDIAEDFAIIQQRATQKTQADFNLSSTWVTATKDPAHWIPTSTIGITPPTDTGLVFLNNALVNCNQVLKDMTAVYSIFPEALEGSVVEKDKKVEIGYYKTILIHLQRYIDKLRESMLISTEQEVNLDKKVKEENVNFREAIAKSLDQIKSDILDQRRKANAASKKIAMVGLVISIVASFAGVAISIMTLGIGSPAGVAIAAAGIAVGLAMTSYTVADHFTNCTQKIVGAFDKFIEKLVPVPPNREIDQKAVKLTCVVIASLILISTIALSASAGAKLAVNTVGKIAQKFALESTKQLSLQTLAMVVMSSQALPEYLGALFKKSGWNDNAIQATQIVSMIISMAAIVLIGAKANGTNFDLVNRTKNLGSSIKSSIETAIQNIKEASLIARQKIAEFSFKQIIEIIEEIMNKIRSLVINAGPSIQKRVSDAVEEVGRKMREMARQASQQIRDITQEIYDHAMARLNAIRYMRWPSTTFLAQEINQIIQEARRSAHEAIKQISRQMTNTIKHIMQPIISACETLKELGLSVKSTIREILETIKDLTKIAMERIIKEFHHAMKMILDPIRELLEILKRSPTENLAALKANWSAFKVELRKLTKEEVGMFVVTLAEASPAVAEAVGGAYQANTSRNISKMLEEKGDMEGSQEFLKEMISLLDRLIKSLQSRIESQDDFIQEIGENIKSLYRGAGQVIDKLSQTFISHTSA